MHFKKFVLMFFEDLNRLIRSPQFLQRHRLDQKFFTRSRKLDFPGIIRFLLRIPQKTLSCEMADFVSQFLASTDIQRISKQAFSSARQKISWSAFQELLDFSYPYLHCLCANRILWYGHAVKAIDGTTLRVPGTPENRKEFQTQKNQHGEVALAKASVLYHLSDDLVEKAVFGKCRDSEKNQALELLTPETLHDESGYRPVILFDRGYPSGELISHIDGLGGLFLMRCPSSTFKNVRSCPQGISDTSISYHNRKIKIRVIRFFLDSGNEEILITNVFDGHIGILGFKWLYNMRWNCETKYAELKQQLKIENFSGIKTVAARQEMYATLVFSNIVSILKSFIDVEIKRDAQGSGNKWEYQANRNFLIGEVKKKLHMLLGGSQVAATALEGILFLSQKERSPIRPDRKKERIFRIYSKTAVYCNNQRTAV